MSTNTKKMIRKFFHDPMSAFGAISFILIVTLCLLAPVIAKSSPTDFDFSQAKLLPSSKHLFGTDNIGRDMFSRVLNGGRNTLFAALVATVISTIFGTTLGIYAGYYDNVLSNVIQRMTEIIDSIPYVLLVIMFEYLLGFGSGSFMYGLGVAAIPATIQTVRAEVLRIKHKEYMEAARALGLSDIVIIQKHVLNNIAGTVIMQICSNYSEAVLACTVLGYLYIGYATPLFDWGTLVADGFNWLRYYPHISLIPTFTIVWTIISLNLIGKGIRDVYGSGDRA